MRRIKKSETKTIKNKALGMWYSGEKQQMHYSWVTLGDTALVKQDRQNKLTTNFNEMQFTSSKPGSGTTQTSNNTPNPRNQTQKV